MAVVTTVLENVGFKIAASLLGYQSCICCCDLFLSYSSREAMPTPLARSETALEYTFAAF